MDLSQSFSQILCDNPGRGRGALSFFGDAAAHSPVLDAGSVRSPMPPPPPSRRARARARQVYMQRGARTNRTVSYVREVAERSQCRECVFVANVTGQ